MMTVVDENNQTQKYEHIVFVEFCEYIARVAFIYHDVKSRCRSSDQDSDQHENFDEDNSDSLSSKNNDN